MLDYSICPNPILTFDLGLGPDMKIDLLVYESLF